MEAQEESGKEGGGMSEDLSRVEKAKIALWDYGSRPGATAKNIRRNMKNAGFTSEEIAEAASQMVK